MQYQELKEAIEKAVPSIETRGDIVADNIFYNLGNAPITSDWWNLKDANVDRVSRSIIYQETSSSITLADVLIALGLAGGCWAVEAGRGTILEWQFDKWVDTYYIWDLKNDLDNQTDKVKQFLYDLICK